jgi:single-strand DNA-binding protein
MLNNCVLQGRLVRDIELKNVGNDNTLASFTIATDSDNKNKDTYFIDCISFNGTADFISKYFRKGSQIIVVGSLQSRKWVDKSGNNRINWEINVNKAYFCGKQEEVKPQNVFYEEPEDMAGELPF